MLRPNLLKYCLNLRVLNSIRLDSLSRRITRNEESMTYLRNRILTFHNPSASDIEYMLTRTEIVFTIDAGQTFVCLDKESGDVIILVGGVIQHNIDCGDHIVNHLSRHRISNKDKLNKLL